MNNKHLLLFTIIGVALILYGIFSCWLAFDTMYHIHKSETKPAISYEVITASGNKIEYYNMD